MQNRPAGPALRYGVPVLATLVVAAVRYGLAPVLGATAPLLLFVLAVFVSGWFGGLTAGLLATALGTAAGAVMLDLFVPDITRLGAAVNLVGFAAIGVLISVRSEALHAARRRAEAIAWDAVARSEQLQRAVAGQSRAEEALHVTQERLRIVHKATHDAVWDWDLTSNAVVWNEGLAALFGYPANQLATTAQWRADRLHPEDRERVSHGLRGVIEHGGALWRDEYRFRRADGSYAYVLDRGQVVRTGAGRAARMVGVMVDLTERRRAEEALRQSEARFRQLADAMPQMVWTTRPDGEYFYLNKRWHEYTGIDLERAVGWGWLGAVHPDDRTRVEMRWRQSVATGEPYEAEYRIRRAADGSPRWHLVRAVPVRGPDGRVVEWFGTSTDVDDRLAAEEALRQSEERYRTVITASPLPVVVWDGDGRVVEWNPAAERVFGYTAAEVLGWDGVPPIVTAESRPTVEDTVRRLTEGAAIVSHTSPYQTRDGRAVLCEWHNAAVRDGGGRLRYGISIAQDVTERHQAEDQRRRLEAQIQQAQKLESLGVLAGGIAHDFNNLLMGMLGYASLALAELPADAATAESVRQIETAALRAADLTRQMLAYSGKGRFIVQPLELSKLVEEMLGLLRMTISKKAVLATHFVEELPTVEGDATQVRQVVMNLITNASEALGDRSGTITVTTGVQEVDADYLADTYLNDRLPEGRYVFLEVADTGAGMDAETKKRLFDPFFTTKFTGRGLGLAAVLGIVRGHRGAIKVYSEPGRGTSMKVLLPASGRPPVAPPAPPKPAEGWRGSGTVLVADDEPTVRSLAGRVLERAGFAVLLAADGREALEQFRANAETVTAVLLDLTMPHLGGEEVFRELRKLRPGVCVILSSGYNEQEATNRFAGKGLAGFLQKPYRPDDLLAKLRQALAAAPG